jgi:exodeoxyribonuclease V alpha subunit
MARHTTTATGLDAPVEPLAGSVEQVMFRSEETGCYGLQVKVHGQRDLVTVVGTAPLRLPRASRLESSL